MVIAKPSNQLSERSTVTVDTGATQSAIINMAGRHPVGIFIPAEFNAGAITFEVGYDGTTMFDLYDNAEAVYDIAIPVVGAMMQIDPQLFRGALYMRLTCAVAQTATPTDFVVMFAEPNKNF